MTISVFLVDDQDLVRTGCAMVINAQPDMRVAGEAGSGLEALRRITSPYPDVVLMDIRMPGLDGVATTRRLLERPGPLPKIIALTTFDLDEYAFAALAAGASGFLLKDAAAEDMLAAIRTVHAGHAVVAPSTTWRLIQHVRPHLTPPDEPAGDLLTAREREIVGLIAGGANNTEIGTSLFLSTSTVKSHVGNILRKLDLTDRVHIVIWAYEHGLRPR